jgi:serpin B
MLTRRRFLQSAAAGLAAAGCSGTEADPDPEPTLPPPSPDELKALVAGDTRFGCDLLAAAGKPGENLILSPFGVSAVFGMVSHGARGKTLDQMRTVLHLPADDRAVAAGFGELSRQVNAVGRGGAIELATANAVWGQKGYPWRAEYLDTLKGGYGAAVREADFAANAERERQAINRWVEGRTRERIKDLIAQGVLDALTRMVLVNAVYMKAKWEHEFDPKLTRPQPFAAGGGAPVSAPLMYQKEHFPLLETDTFQAIELPYKGRQVSMLAFLPRAADGLPAFEKLFTSANLAKWTADPWPTPEVKTYLPRWKAETTTDLKTLLVGMGMTDLFDPNRADLSGMADTRELYVSAAVQKAFVEVNEEGTEAAAATAAVAATRAAPVPTREYVFRADRPFVYALRHNPTGTLLFVGRVAKP